MGGVEFNKNTFNEIITGRINLNDGFKWVDEFGDNVSLNNEQGTSLAINEDGKLFVGCRGGNGNYIHEFINIVLYFLKATFHR